MPLHERWQAGVDAEATDPERIEDRLRQWRQALSLEGDSTLLTRRLAADGLDLETCRPWLGSVRLPDDQPLPVWADRFRVLLRHCGPPQERSGRCQGIWP